MIPLEYFITPLGGAVIGYFTNWLAIKMLFKPHTEKRLGSIKIPFTPGLIPKEKEKIAKKLGATVGNHLLTEEAILKSLQSQEMLEKISEFYDKGLTHLQSDEKTLDCKLSELLGEEKSIILEKTDRAIMAVLAQEVSKQENKDKLTSFLYGALREFVLNRPLREMDMEHISSSLKELLLIESKNLQESGILQKNLEKSLWDYLVSQRENEKKLNEIMTYSSIQMVKDYLSLKTPNIVRSLLDLAQKPEIEEKLKQKMDDIKSEFAGFMGMFVNTDHMYQKMIDGISRYYSDPSNQEEIDSFVSMIVDRAAESTVGSLANIMTGELRENTLNRILDSVLENFLREENITGMADKFILYCSEKSDKTPGGLLALVDPDYENKVLSLLTAIVERLCNENATVYLLPALSNIRTNLLKTKISCIFSKLPEELAARIRLMAVNGYKSAVRELAPGIIDKLNIPHIVEDQINQMDTSHTEELILSITKKELNAITYVGGLLGFVIGLLPMAINLF